MSKLLLSLMSFSRVSQFFCRWGEEAQGMHSRNTDIIVCSGSKQRLFGFVSFCRITETVFFPRLLLILYV